MATEHRPSRTQLYIQTYDDGVAPCAPPPTGQSPALLTLAICKPAIRRNAQVGDTLIGLTGSIIEERQGYPKNAVIYSAIVDEVMPGKDYYTSKWAHRLDCVYQYDQSSEKFIWDPTTKIHEKLEEQEKDIGRNNAKALICRDFRYFGKDAVEIPELLAPKLRDASEKMGQGCPVFTNEGEMREELEGLHQYLWSNSTTPPQVLKTPRLITELRRECAVIKKDAYLDRGLVAFAKLYGPMPAL